MYIYDFMNSFYILLGICAIFVKVKDSRYLSSKYLKNKVITNEEMYLKYCRLDAKITGIIVMAMGFIGIITLNSEMYNILIAFFGFTALLIEANYFEYKKEKFIKDKK